MNNYIDLVIWNVMPWPILCTFSLILFLGGWGITVLLIGQKRNLLLWLAIPTLCISYFLMQCFVMINLGYARSQIGFEVFTFIAELHSLLLWGSIFFMVLVEALLIKSILLYERMRITPMSVKEAIDSLPAGLLYYAPTARVILVNRTMQELCRKATGMELEDGATFRNLLMEGDLLPACNRVFAGTEPVIILADETAYKINENDIAYEGHSIRMLLAIDVTEAYRCTREYIQRQEELEELGKRLQEVNREIMEVTAKEEVLNSKIRIHNELGSNLLDIKRYLVNGGTEEEKKELLKRIGRGVSFLKRDTTSAPVHDEYELLFSMAEWLGLTISVIGELPQKERIKTIMAAAIHECLTNTLRHAQGNELQVSILEDEEWVIAILTNNGSTPKGEIVEKGGFRSLRELTEQAGGSLTIKAQPSFTVTLRLPKEDAYGI